MSWIENNEWLKPDKDHRVRWDAMRRFLEHYRPYHAHLAAAGGLALVASSTIFLIPWIFRGLQRALIGRDVERITWLILAFLGVTLLEICVSAGIRLLQSRVSIQLNRDLLLRYYGKILNLAVEDFIAFRQRTNLFQRIIDAMSVTGGFTTILVRGGQVTIAVSVLAGAIAILSPAVLGLLALGSAGLFIHVFFRARTISSLQKKLLAINYPLVGKMTEVLEGLFTIKALAASVQVTSDVQRSHPQEGGCRIPTARHRGAVGPDHAVDPPGRLGGRSRPQLRADVVRKADPGGRAGALFPHPSAAAVRGRAGTELPDAGQAFRQRGQRL